MSYLQQRGHYNIRSPVASSIATDDIINNIEFNIKKMRNIFRIYIDKYKYYENNKLFNNQYINSLDFEKKKHLINKLIEFNSQIIAFLNLNNQHPIQQNVPYQQQSYFGSYFGGKKSKKAKKTYIKTALYHKIGNKKHLIYLGSRGAKYIKKDNKYISIKAL